jgi:DNA-binding FadR family transcriptional regulator
MSKKPVFAQPVKKQTMAEQMAETIQESILSGELVAGTLLPTEPELAEQFGVSRAVVRDGTRILMARGLVEVQHGRGVFVTHPDNEAFGAALLLALRRAGASAWDAEQFEQILFPEVVALAAASATEQDVAGIQQLAQKYIALVAEYHQNWWRKQAPVTASKDFMVAYRQFMQAIFDASHNRVLQQLAQPLLNLRNLRNWADSDDDTLEAIMEIETHFVNKLVEAIVSRNPAQARSSIACLMELPPEAVAAMQKTPVGEITIIPVPLSKLGRK